MESDDALEWFAVGELESDEDVPFGQGAVVRRPHGARAYLDRAYPGWSRKAVVQGHHTDIFDFVKKVVLRHELEL